MTSSLLVNNDITKKLLYILLKAFLFFDYELFNWICCMNKNIYVFLLLVSNYIKRQRYFIKAIKTNSFLNAELYQKQATFFTSESAHCNRSKINKWIECYSIFWKKNGFTLLYLQLEKINFLIVNFCFVQE